MNRLPALVFTTMLAAACAGTPPPATPSTRPANAAVAGVPDGGLPAQRLAPGECGLFIWQMAEPRAFIFFARNIDGEALALIGDKPQTLTPSRAGGDVFGQFLTEMDYVERQSGTQVQLRFRPGEMLEGGQRIEGGFLVFRDRQGWETTRPVTGVRACQSR